MRQPNVRYNNRNERKLTLPHRREEILQAAVRLFAQKGYHATSMQDLAEALGIQRGSIYHHIESKEDLLYEIMESSITRLIEPVEALVSSPLPAGEKLDQFIECHLDTIVSLQAELRVFLQELKSLPPQRRRKIIAYRDHYEGFVRGIIAEGVASGEFRPVTPKFAGLAVLAVCNWFCQWYSPRGSLSRAQIARIFADLLLRGLAASPDVVLAAGPSPAHPDTRRGAAGGEAKERTPSFVPTVKPIRTD